MVVYVCETDRVKVRFRSSKDRSLSPLRSKNTLQGDDLRLCDLESEIKPFVGFSRNSLSHRDSLQKVVEQCDFNEAGFSDIVLNIRA
jgi:hypothetical protein